MVLHEADEDSEARGSETGQGAYVKRMGGERSEREGRGPEREREEGKGELGRGVQGKKCGVSGRLVVWEGVC